MSVNEDRPMGEIVEELIENKEENGSGGVELG
jgi:hypothetical protein